MSRPGGGRCASARAQALTGQNKEALPDGMLQRYRETVAALAGRYGAIIIDADVDGYALSDFDDSCRMNAREGQKFYAHLVDKLAGDSSIGGRLR